MNGNSPSPIYNREQRLLLAAAAEQRNEVDDHDEDRYRKRDRDLGYLITTMAFTCTVLAVLLFGKAINMLMPSPPPQELVSYSYSVTVVSPSNSTSAVECVCNWCNPGSACQ